MTDWKTDPQTDSQRHALTAWNTLSPDQRAAATALVMTVIHDANETDCVEILEMLSATCDERFRWVLNIDIIFAATKELDRLGLSIDHAELERLIDG